MNNSESEEDVVSLISKWNYVREHVSTKWLQSPTVWNVLLPQMPAVALLRNLNKITATGVFDAYPITRSLVEDKIKTAKVHPLQMLIALKMYSKGSGDKGKLEWQPKQWLISCLNDAFYTTFKNVKATNKRYLLTIDVSGSMSYTNMCGISCLSAAEVACAMAMVLDQVETDVDIMGFADKFRALPVSCTRRLDDNLKTTQDRNFGATDISLPFTWALEKQTATESNL